MSKIVTTIAVLMLAFSATASAGVSQDHRSPDARPANAAQDYRSPDAAPQRASSSAQDYRSPDARVSVDPVFSGPATAAHASSSSDWAYLALALAVAIAGIGGLVVAQRRRRHGLAIGS